MQFNVISRKTKLNVGNLARINRWFCLWPWISMQLEVSLLAKGGERLLSSCHACFLPLEPYFRKRKLSYSQAKHSWRSNKEIKHQSKNFYVYDVNPWNSGILLKKRNSHSQAKHSWRINKGIKPSSKIFLYIWCKYRQFMRWHCQIAHGREDNLSFTDPTAKFVENLY